MLRISRTEGVPTNLQSCGHQKEVRKHPQDTTARLTWTRRPETTESISATGSSVAETRAGPMNEHRQSRHCPTLLLWNLHERRKSNKERERESYLSLCTAKMWIPEVSSANLLYQLCTVGSTNQGETSKTFRPPPKPPQTTGGPYGRGASDTPHAPGKKRER